MRSGRLALAVCGGVTDDYCVVLELPPLAELNAVNIEALKRPMMHW